MQRRSFMALAGSCLVCGCAGAVHRLPEVSDGNIAAAQAEVRMTMPPQHCVSESCGARLFLCVWKRCGSVGDIGSLTEFLLVMVRSSLI